MRTRALACVAVMAALLACSKAPSEIVVGAVYPTGGGQGPGGIEEQRGVLLAAELTNADGGVRGKRIRVVTARADSAEAAPRAVDSLVRDGATVILGSYGSTISRTAAAAAAKHDVVFWETGAVGMIDAGRAAGRRVFRFPPTGGSLGREAVSFVRDRLTPLLGRSSDLRYAVVYVDDVYGRSVGFGALEEIRASGLTLAGEIAYDIPSFSGERIAEQIARLRPDVLVVAAYLDDGVQMRRALVTRRVPLVAGIGTSSSYCHPAFGQALGDDAVGLFASDKPDGDVLKPWSLAPDAAATLVRARDEYLRRYGEPMGGAALSGFSAAWALFRHVMPSARALDADGISLAALTVKLPLGALPNGSGLAFAPLGTLDAGANLRATSVIWEWTAPAQRTIVWPPVFATHDIVPLRPR